jgi:signal transduction histidine kinase
MDFVVALAGGDSSARVAVVGDGSVLDGIATGLNMLADELAQRTGRDQEYQRRLLHVERLAAVGQLAAGLAHEINNPAAFLLTNLRVLKDHAREMAALCATCAAAVGQDEPRLARILKDVREIADENLEGIQRISRVTRSLLGFARVDAAGLEPVGLDAVAEEACGLTAPEISSRARLVKRLEPVPRVTADGAGLLQVATALLVNAAHALPDGAPERHEIEISTGVDDGQVYLQVRDTGAAIPQQLGERAFEPFFTASPARAGGTGLELFLAAEVMRAHGGSIRCWPAGATGTIFRALLPLPARPAPAEPRPSAGPRRLPRILVVDDEPTLLAAYRRLLASRFDVSVAGGGREAIELLDRDASWDAVVCDLVMPDLDGQAVYRHLEARNPALARRMVFCTAGAFTPRAVAFAEEMRGRFLPKPLEPEQLEKVVRELGRLVG